MKRNMGNADRLIRFLLGFLFIGLFALKAVTGTWGVVLVVVGGVFILTSLISFCPLYTLFGISTCSAKKA